MALSLPLLSGIAGAQVTLRGWGWDSYFDDAVQYGSASFASANLYNTLVVRADGRLYVRGGNYSNVCRAPEAPPGLIWTDAQTGWDFGIGRLSDGSLMLWGGVTNYWPVLALPSLPQGMSYIDYAVGSDHALLLRSDGVLLAIGKNLYGQSTVPQFPPGLAVVTIFAGSGNSAAILSDGSLWMWGIDDYGQSTVPALPAGLSYSSVAMGNRHTLALRSDGSMVAFGWGAVGLNTVPALPPGVTWTMCAAGAFHSVGVRSDGLVEAWGDNFWQQTSIPALPPIPIVDVDAGVSHTVVLFADGSVRTWGWNTHFQCDLPEAPIAPPGQQAPRYTGIAGGGAFCLALRSDGTVVGFGDNSAGQLAVPITLPWAPTYEKVVAGKFDAAAIRSDGMLLMWGFCGAWCNVPPPLSLPVGVRYVDVSLSTIHTVALRSDGQAVTWGSNSWGIGTIPPLPAGMSYTAVEAHYARTLLLRSDDTLFSLGNITTSLGQLQYPAPLPPGVHYAQVAVSRTYDAALRTDGTAVLWGSGGTTPPPALPWGVYYVEVEGGEDATVLRRSDGTAAVCGQIPARWYPPTLDAGTSYLEFDASDRLLTARVGPSTTYTGLAPGCSGTLGTPRLIPADTPRIGRDLVVRAFDLPADLALCAMSFTTPSQPVPLAAFGMPGCDWHIGFDGAALLVGADGVAELTLPIPDQPGLVGLRFQHQALVLDPGAGNAFGAVVSDAMEGVIGYP